MDFLLLLQALILGIVEGLTEILPISSTGHLIVTADLMNFWTPDKRVVFEIAIQLGAILAVCWDYRLKLMTVKPDLSVGIWKQSWLAWLAASQTQLAGKYCVT